ncbi:MAG TPA: PAS domain S-box protein [Candidatus Brocadiia bacterium]|nr:PAS domain S-box protein [Candidatus Brocadiia bacterium]
MADAGEINREMERLKKRVAEMETRNAELLQTLAALRKSEEQHRSLQENLPIGVFRSDLEGKVIAANAAMARMVGYESVEAMLEDAPTEADFVVPGKRAELIRITDETGFITDYETRLIHRSGTEFWASISVRAVKDDAGNVTHYDGTVTDITERRKTQEALRNSERKYRLLADNVSDVIWIMDMNLRFTYMSPSVVHMRGYSLDEAMGQTMQEALTPQSVALARRIMEEEITRETTGTTDPFRTRTLLLQHRCKDGSAIWCETKVSFIRDERGEPAGILGVDRDVTQRRLIEDQMERLNRFLNLVIESVNVMLYVLDEQERVIIWNKAAEEISGYPADEVLNSDHVWELIYPSAQYREDLRELAPGLFDGRRPVNGFETTIRAKDGRERHILWQSRSMWDDNRRLHGCVVLGHDVTEQRLAEKALRESEEKYRTLVENAEEGICVLGPDGMISYTNELAARELGIVMKDIAAVPVWDLLPRKDADVVMAAVRSVIATGKGVTRDINLDLIGANRWLRLSIQPIRDASGKPVSTLVFAFDISDRRRLESELLNVSNVVHKGIGEDLEEGPVKTLEELSRECAALRDALAAGRIPEAGQAERIAAAADRAMTLTRDMANMLNPLALNAANLEIAIRDLAKTASELYGIECSFKCFANTTRISRPTSANLYHIAEEAVSTAAKRHKAKTVQIGLFEKDSNFVLMVRHDIGAEGGSDEERRSLDTIESRARMMGGTVEFRNNDDGTRTITCKIPAAA